MPHFSKAHEQYVIAKHLLNTTLPLIKDPKLLIGITHNIFDSMDHVTQVLTDTTSIAEKTTILVRLNPIFGKQFNELQRTIQSYKKSPVVFRRQENFIICNEEYDLEPITEKKVQEQLKILKQLLIHVSTIRNRKG